MEIAVIGSGSWGTALATVLARNGHDVTLLGRNLDEIASIREDRQNLRYLPGFDLPKNLRADSLDTFAGTPAVWIVAVPSDAVQSILHLIPKAGPKILMAAKGLQPDTASLLAQVARDEFPTGTIAALSGPNLAVELMRAIPTATVVASHDVAFAEELAHAFNCRALRAYISDDLIGVELAGALKNVLAVAAGMSDGLGFGDNTKGALLSRGLLEMTKLGMACGATPETFFGIAGVGDLFATGASKLSRNYRVGVALGQGRTLDEALKEIGQVAEGVKTATATLILAKRHAVEVPIFAATQAVIAAKLTPGDAVSMLMERMPKTEGFSLSAWRSHTPS